MERTSFKVYLPQLALLLMAAAPSLLFYLLVPFFWNNTDAIVYLTVVLHYAVPQYPPFYNGLCEALMTITQQGPAALYLLIFFQHVVYVAGLLYLCGIFKSTRARLIFLAVMATNWNTLTVINGIFPEGMFAGFELFFWGGILRTLLRGQLKWTTAVVWGVSLIMLTLTKHIGQLWYAYPMAVASVLLMAGILGKNIIAKRKSKRILGTTVISFALLLCIQHITMWYLRIQNPVSIGRQGAYRIREMPYNKMNARDKEALIQHYTGGSNDPMLRPTFESMFVTRPWGETYYRVDSILKARHITGRDADDCLNAAFKAYMLHMEHYGWQSAMHDLDWSLNLEHIANCIITVNTLSLFDKNYFPGPLQSKWSGSFSHEKYQKISSFCNSEWLETFTPFTLHSLMVICFLLLPISLLKLRWQQALLIILPVAFAWFVMFINCIITVYILRYVLASYMEAYMVMALLLTIIVSPKKQLAGE